MLSPDANARDQDCPQFKLEILEGKMSGTMLSLLVESKLFIVARGLKKLPDRIDHFYPELFEFGASERIINFFAHSYENRNIPT